MPRISGLFSTLFVTALAAGALAASAADRSFGIPPQAMTPRDAATIGSSVNLPETGVGGVQIVFVVPADFDGLKRLELRVYSETEETACDAVYRVTERKQRRVNQATSGTTYPNIDNVVSPSGEIVSFSGLGVTNRMLFIIRNPLQASFKRIKPGDVFRLRIERLPADVGDTCLGSVYITGAEVAYTALTP